MTSIGDSLSSELMIAVGNEKDTAYEELMDRLEREPMPWKLLCEAIRCGDEITFRQESPNFKGLTTLAAKKQAILARRPDFLRQLLEEDSCIEDDTVVTACDQKDHESITILLQFGWPINKALHHAASLLCTAVDDVEFMQWLIDSGADVNARSELDESALSIAIAHGSIGVVRLLLTHGVDITHGDLLHCAAERSNQLEGAELVEELVKKGAPVNAHRFYNEVAFKMRGMSTLLTPLHVACLEENVPVVKSLLQHGADPHHMLLRAGRLAPPTPLDLALKSRSPVLSLLLNEEHSIRV